jgi:hypothetical protein
MAPRRKPDAIVQWWLDKQTHLERQLTLARKGKNQREIDRLKSGIKRIGVMLASMKR